MKGNWCRDVEDGCLSYCQPVLKTATGTHPFFNHQKTPEGRDVAVRQHTHTIHLLSFWQPAGWDKKSTQMTATEQNCYM